MHGFRVLARTILDEVLVFRPFVEYQLAHAAQVPAGRLKPEDVPARSAPDDACAVMCWPVIIEILTAFAQTKVDEHEAKAVRLTRKPLARSASDSGVGVLVICHARKRNSHDSTHEVYGSGPSNRSRNVCGLSKNFALSTTNTG